MIRRNRPARPQRRTIPLSTIQQASPETLAAAFAAPPEEAAPWIEAAAMLGQARAQVLWGQYLLDALGGVARDQAAAAEWFRSAARAGDAAGMNMLGRCYENGWGIAADYAEAVRWFRGAAEAGFDWGQYNLANMYLRGDGIAEDRAEALRWYHAAAAQGHAKSINMVARFYEEGWVVARDPARAALLYAASAERGDFRGQFNLGVLLADRGEMDEATRWFREAARTAHDDFRRGMVERLAARPEPALRQVAAEIAAGLT
ncbi:sel1 repeat family protein [Roseomonas terrae]|uniref:Sel1 repeat family protein n=1 Tax=Neoroseomonas terrae TaxID=424799 RepID=A0ABS5EIW0_9PROT|nr:tetratricopeptide repeat protein [Neoroseomonas terrae]MBR0650969.1 sel1 repeat family protein [Neoroseomonas terrae]